MPRLLLKAGGRPCYIFGLLVSQAALAIVSVPLTVEVMSQMFSVPMEFRVADVAKVVLKTILLPFLPGLAIDGLFGEQAHRAGRIIARIGNVLLICVVIPLVPFAWGASQTLVGQGVLAGLGALVLIGLAVGHFLADPTSSIAQFWLWRQLRRILAWRSRLRTQISRSNRGLSRAVVIYMILRALLIIPYIRWRRRPSGHGGDVHVPARA
jgi:hypothetical protein